MLQKRIKRIFKRRRHIKSRYSAKKIYVSRAELKHTNTKLLIILYTYNKQKSSLEGYLRKILILIRIYAVSFQDKNNIMVRHRNRIIKIFKNNLVCKKVFVKKRNELRLKQIVTYTNRLIHLLKKKYFVFKK